MDVTFKVEEWPEFEAPPVPHELEVKTCVENESLHLQRL